MNGYVIDDDRGYYAKKVEILNKREKQILKLIANGVDKITEIAEKLGISPQLVSYYINRKLKPFIEFSGLGKNRLTTKKAFFMIIDEEPDFVVSKTGYLKLEPYIKDRVLDSIVVVGAPIPHGQFSASARDLHYVGFLMAHLGKFFDKTKYDNFIRLDIDVIRENLLNNNLIVIGGPIVNTITYRLNVVMKIRFLQEYNWDLYSDFKKVRYSDERHSLIANIQSPFDESKKVLVLAGKRAIGTKLAIRYFVENNLDLKKDFYIVLRGMDYDGDGIPESIVVEEEVEL